MGNILRRYTGFDFITIVIRVFIIIIIIYSLFFWFYYFSVFIIFYCCCFYPIYYLLVSLLFSIYSLLSFLLLNYILE